MADTTKKLSFLFILVWELEMELICVLFALTVFTLRVSGSSHCLKKFTSALTAKSKEHLVKQFLEGANSSYCLSFWTVLETFVYKFFSLWFAFQH